MDGNGELELYKLIAENAIKIISFMSASFGVLFWHLYKKVGDTFSKEETEKFIDLKIIPLTDSLERNSNLLTKQNMVLDKLNDSLQLLHTDMSIVKFKMDNLEEKMK